MPTNLTGEKIKDSYAQLLHVNGGPEATKKTVFGGAGVATALSVGTESISVDNLTIDGNTISATDTDGGIILSPNGTGAVDIAKANITGGSVTGITDLAVADGGTGASDAFGARTNLGLGTMSTQNADNVAIIGGSIAGVAFSGSFTGLTSIESTTFATSDPVAGCNLSGNVLAADGTDTNIGLAITPKGSGRTTIGAITTTSPRILTSINDTNGNELLNVTATASAVNEITLANAATGNGPTLSATGGDTNVDINLIPKGTGEVNVTNIDVLSGKVPFNTITNRAYASFYDASTTDQSGSTTDRTAVKWATAAVTGAGITVASDSQITLAAAGTYRFNASLQISNSVNTDYDITVWFAKNGTNISHSASKITVPKSSDGGTAVFAIEIFETVAANDYIEVYWYPENAALTLHYIAAVASNPGITPAIPVVPPAIVVVERIA